jgi:hypothetical protein
MKWKKIAGAFILGFLAMAIAHADIIPPGHHHRDDDNPPLPPRNYVSFIEVTVDKIPSGMVLLFIDSHGNLLAKAREKQKLKIDGPGLLYAAFENRLSNPFVFNREEQNLYLLRSVGEVEIPSSFDGPVPPKTWKCRITKDKKSGFALEVVGDK